jgi:glutathione synthase/RimK-type ligase-like ATP-grasp enzyme
LTLAYDRDEFAASWDGGAIPPDVSAVWHRVVVGDGLPAMAPGVRETCVAAAERTVIGLLDSLPVFQLDPPARMARADHKPAQLREAQRLGLDVPATIVTNDAAAVRAFAERTGPVVAKMLVQPVPGEPRSGGREADVVFTTALGAADLADLDGLDLCPMIFQERIASRRDVRVTVVGRQVFAAALERSATESGDELDWRRDSYARDRAPVWAPYDLPAGLGDRLVQLVDRFGLEYGAADLVVGPGGRHAFLELNAAGSFAFLGAALAGSIAAAIAEVLIDPGARRTAGGSP